VRSAVFSKLSADNFGPPLGDTGNRGRHVPATVDKEFRQCLSEQFRVSSLAPGRGRPARTTRAAGATRCGRASGAGLVAGPREGGPGKIHAGQWANGLVSRAALRHVLGAVVRVTLRAVVRVTESVTGHAAP